MLITKFAANGFYKTDWVHFLNSIPSCAGKADNTGVRFPYILQLGITCHF